MAALASFQVGRLVLGPPSTPLSESVGDPIASLGGGVVPAPRTAPTFGVALVTYVGSNSSVATGQLIRRQLRSLLNNTPLKLQGYVYVIYSDDTEQNGWYVPDQNTLSAIDRGSWKGSGFWQTGTGSWMIVGRQRTHREAREVWMKDLRTGLYQRDYLGWVLTTDFSWLPSLLVSVLPNGATSAIQSVTGQVVQTVALPTGRDGGACGLLTGLTDTTTVSYERAESALNLSDVIVYDRVGQITSPSTGPDTNWVEFYGTDWPGNWNTSGQPNDAPVLDNGLVRVRYDHSVGAPGLRVDVWNGSAYVEQGKMVQSRDGHGAVNTWIAAGLAEYTPDRAVLRLVTSLSSDASSREVLYVTVQRGELSVTFEYYPALTTAGGQSDCQLIWTPALNSGAADLNQSAVKIDSQGTGNWTPGAAGTAAFVATAGTGAGSGNSGQYGGTLTTLGNANFSTSENWVGVLRYPTTYNVIGTYQATLVVQQAANALLQYVGSNSAGYGVSGSTDAYEVQSQNSAGYLQAQVCFAATQAQQVLEAEGMTLGSGTSSTADANASGGFAATATRTTDANAHTTQATWPNGVSATYRVFLRVNVSAGTGSFYVKTGATTGTTVTTTSTSYVWLDMGEIAANNTTFEVHAWISTGSGTIRVDRMEACLVVDQARTGAIYSGSRDVAQAALEDSRMLGAVVSR